jgi:hypothetical protein
MAKYKIVKPHFRMHKINGHPSYIYADNGIEYKYIGITHSNLTDGVKNIKLKYDPNINSKDIRPSHIRPFSTHDYKYNFKSRKKKFFRIHKADKRKISKVKKNYKK